MEDLTALMEVMKLDAMIVSIHFSCCVRNASDAHITFYYQSKDMRKTKDWPHFPDRWKRLQEELTWNRQVRPLSPCWYIVHSW